MPFLWLNSNSRLNPSRSSPGSQDLAQPQNTYKRFKFRLFRRSRHHDTTPQIPAVDITTPGTQKTVPDEHENHASSWASGTPHPPASMQAEGRNSFPNIAEPAIVPMGTQLQGAQRVDTPHHNTSRDIAEPTVMAAATQLQGAQSVDTPHYDSFNPQAQGRNPVCDTAEPARVPMATQFQGAQGVNISGDTRFTNIGVNKGNLTTVYNYGGTHGLENLKEYVSFAALYDSAEQDHDRRCHPGTRENVLGRLRGWIDNPNPTEGICWLHGPAGAGKSAIAQTIADAYNQGEVAATFFFFRSDPARNDGNRLFPTIAWQLAFSISATKDFIVHALDKTPHLPMKRIETQFEQLLAYPFQSMNNIAPRMPQRAPVVIIDGVDECLKEELQRRILTVIGNAVKDRHVLLRFLICSRPEALIEETLDQFKDFTLRIDLATLDDANHDIEKYLVDKFSDISSKRGLSATWPGQEIIQDIVFKSSGNFILPSTLIRFISDEDYDPETQLLIIQDLKPRGKMSPFAFLDELYLEILKRQIDQDFLKTFLVLLVGRSSVQQDDLAEDDAMLLNISKKELHTKLRKMRSLFNLEPFVDIYHKSFLDFLQDSSRSGQYHVSKQNGQKQYLELIVDSVVRHVSMAIHEPNRHEMCRSSPKFKYIVKEYPPKIALPVEDWQEVSRPLLDLQEKLLSTSKCQPCRVTQVMRELLLHLVMLQRKPLLVAVAQALESNKSEAVTERSNVLLTDATQSIPETDFDSCFSVLLSCPMKTKSVLTVDAAIIDSMSSLLAFDHAETAARVRSFSDAQKLIDLIDLLTNDESSLSQCGPDGARRAAHLASEIFARVPVLPQFLFFDRLVQHRDWSSELVEMEHLCQSALIGRILDHDYVVPVLGIYSEDDAKNDGQQFRFVNGDRNEWNESVSQWLASSKPSFVTRIQAVLEIARTIQYTHSMGIIPHSERIRSESFLLDPNIHVKIKFFGTFAWWPREASSYVHEASGFMEQVTYDRNIFAFADLFQKVCFERDSAFKPPFPPDGLNGKARQLIQQCRDEGNRPNIEEVIKEMESWNLAPTIYVGSHFCCFYLP